MSPWLRNRERSIPSSAIASTVNSLAGWPSSACRPALATRTSPRFSTMRRKSPSAMGERQLLPVQTKRTFFTGAHGVRAAGAGASAILGAKRAKGKRQNAADERLAGAVFCLLPFRFCPTLRSVSALSEPAALAPYLPDVYRFAFLMLGETVAAAAVLRRTVERAVRAGIADLRDARRVKRWLFTEARQQCAQGAPAPAPAPPATEPGELAARFAAVPEAERGALILFYLYLFDPTELAEVLEIPLAELAPLLTRGRASLVPR